MKNFSKIICIAITILAVYTSVSAVQVLPSDLTYGDVTYLNEDFGEDFEIVYHNGANAITSSNITTANEQGTTVEKTSDGKLKFTRTQNGTGTIIDLPVKIDLDSAVSSGKVAVSADITFSGDTPAFSIGQVVNPLTNSGTKINGTTHSELKASAFNTEKTLTAVIDFDNSTETLYLDGELIKKDISNTLYSNSASMSYLVLKIPRNDGVCSVTIDNLTVKEVIDPDVVKLTDVNFNDETAGGLTVSSPSYAEEKTAFGYGNYLSALGSVTYTKEISSTEDYFKTVYSADIKASSGTSFEIFGDNSENSSLKLDFTTEIHWTGQSVDNIGTTEEGKWYHARIEIEHRKNGEAVTSKNATLYLNGENKGTANFADGKISKVVFNGTAVKTDNFKVFTIKGNNDFSVADDGFELRNEIQYAKDLVKYYETKNMSSNTESVASFRFNDSDTYLGGTYYAKYKSDLTKAENLYNGGVYTPTESKEAIAVMCSNLVRVGGDIRELRFDNGLNLGYNGKSRIVTDSYPTSNNYAMQLDTSGYFSFPDTPVKNLDIWGSGTVMTASFDVMPSDTTETIFALTDGTNDIAKIKFAGNGKLSYLSGNTWTETEEIIEQGKWSSIYLMLRMKTSAGAENKKWDVSVDGTSLMSNTSFLSSAENINALSVTLGADSKGVLIDNISIAVQPTSTMPIGDRGPLGKAIRDAYDRLVAYKTNQGTFGGQVSPAQYTALQGAVDRTIGRYNVNKTLRVIAATNGGRGDFTNQITNDTKTVTDAISAFDASVAPYKDWYLTGIKYINKDGAEIVSPQKGGKVLSVEIAKYKEAAAENENLIVAAYTSDLKYLNCKVIALKDVTINDNSVTEVEVNLPITEDDVTVKCFMMPFDTMKPLTEVMENERLKDGNIKLIVLGDSISADYKNDVSDSEKDKTGLSQTLSNYFDTDCVTVDSFARPGLTTKLCFDKGWFNQGLNAASAGDYLVISFGHNDSKGANMLSKEEYSQNLKDMVNLANAKGVNVIFVTPPARLDIGDDFQQNKTALTEYSAEMVKVAKEMKVPCVDLNTKTTAEITENQAVCVDRYMYSINNTDGSHLTYYGADLYSGYIVEGLKNMVHPLAAVTVPHTVGE